MAPFLFAIVLTCCASAASAAESLDLRFLEGLRERRLFELAAEFCQQQLADQQLSGAERATMTIELARCRAGQALNAPPRERDELWRAATAVLSDFLARHPNHPRAFLLRVQEALILLTRGELSRQEAEVGAGSEQALADAREQIREAARRLEELEKDLEREIPRRLNSRPAEGELTSEELASLLDNVRFQLARAYRNQALSYPAGSPDRVSALTQAINRLNDLRRSIGEGDPLYWPCRLDLIACHRLLEKIGEAAQQIAEVESQEPPPSVVLELRAEQARVALAAGRPQVALAAISQGRSAHGEISPELDLAHLETYIALWKSAEAKQEQNDADAWREKAVAMTRLIEESHGPYWRRRAESLLTGSASGSEAAGDLEILVRTARDHYLRKRLDEAVAAYEAAARQAQVVGDQKQAFELFYKAAAVEHERTNHAEAARRFRELALALPTQALAAHAHLMACFDLAQAAREDPSRLNDYAAALEEHVQMWPDVADQARLWLGRLRESQQQWRDAVAAYRGVSHKHAEYEAAIAGAARTWLRILDETAPASEDRHAEAAEAAQFFGQIVYETKGASGKNPVATQTAALAAARIRLHYAENEHAAAERVLRIALENATDAPVSWRNEATGLLVVAMAGQPERVDEALDALRGAAGNSPQHLWEMIQSLANVADQAPQDARPQIASLTLQALDLLEPHVAQLSADAQVTSQRIRAESLAAAGRLDEAKSLYELLARQHPQDARIQKGYGELLLESDDEANRRAALRQWRLIAQKSRPRSELWWRAKYNIALLHYRAGDREQAAQLIRYLKEVPPGLEGSPVESELLELLKRSER